MSILIFWSSWFFAHRSCHFSHRLHRFTIIYARMLFTMLLVRWLLFHVNAGTILLIILNRHRVLDGTYFICFTHLNLVYYIDFCICLVLYSLCIVLKYSYPLFTHLYIFFHITHDYIYELGLLHYDISHTNTSLI